MSQDERDSLAAPKEAHMKITRIAHLGIVVKDLDVALGLFTEALPLDLVHTEDYQGMKIGFIPVGDSSIELLQDVSGSSSIKKFLDNNGEGIHHIAFEVEDIEQAVTELKEKGIKLIDEKPRAGAHGMSVAFMHPKATHGILMELVQPMAKGR
jgi:methylmalonyl-CoA/ethylmalonyl-CoA epimerase